MANEVITGDYAAALLATSPLNSLLSVVPLAAAHHSPFPIIGFSSASWPPRSGPVLANEQRETPFASVRNDQAATSGIQGRSRSPSPSPSPYSLNPAAMPLGTMDALPSKSRGGSDRPSPIDMTESQRALELRKYASLKSTSMPSASSLSIMCWSCLIQGS
jgi:hypothetical protein